MANTVLRYSVPSFNDEDATDFITHLPVGARVLHVAEQQNVICLWALCDVTAKKEPRRIAYFGTGWELPDEYGHYWGSAITTRGHVWHVFEHESTAPKVELPGSLIEQLMGQGAEPVDATPVDERRIMDFAPDGSPVYDTLGPRGAKRGPISEFLGDWAEQRAADDGRSSPLDGPVQWAEGLGPEPR